MIDETKPLHPAIRELIHMLADIAVADHLHDTEQPEATDPDCED